MRYAREPSPPSAHSRSSRLVTSGWPFIDAYAQWRAVSRYKVEEGLAKCVAARTIGFSDVMIIAGLRFRSK